MLLFREVGKETCPLRSGRVVGLRCLLLEMDNFGQIKQALMEMDADDGDAFALARKLIDEGFKDLTKIKRLQLITQQNSIKQQSGRITIGFGIFGQDCA